MTERKKAVYHARILPKPSHSLEITHHLQRAEILRFWNVFASLESEIKTTCAGSVDSELCSSEDNISVLISSARHSHRPSVN
ncbi:hypothetical protein HID58_095785 [Brassica napus]|uniref:Uncharacterized protein n=1 Tax=Brassica napus TaxID=3708 RepID=A0ABQ7X2D7_BRANA|nr:hypothetical protein HID58_095785 [Brassica napus]